MKTLNDLRQLQRVRRPLVLAAGFFDGVHRGHARVVQRAVARARRLNGNAWVLTFDTHPLKVLAPARAPRLLTCTPHKLRLLAALGVHGCLVLRFTRRLARQEPERFVERLCAAAPTLAAILVGGNWRFGRAGRGDAALLKRIGRARGFAVEVVRPVRRRQRPVSSTRVRQAVQRGQLGEAAAMLGRPFSIMATVTRGRRVGRTLGFPTANLLPHNEVMPPPGVYAVRARVGTRMHDGVLNFGYRPTFADAPGRPILELHLLNFRGNLYGRLLEVFFVRRLRAERRFNTLRGLQQRIAADTQAARRALRR